MRGVPRAAGDVALAVFGVLVIVGAVAAVQHGNGSVTSAAVAVVTDSPTDPATEAPASAPSASARASYATSSPAAAGSSVVVAGPDLARLTNGLASVTGFDVISVASASPEVLAPGALGTVTVTPSAVVLQVLAGSKTTMRTMTAITAVSARWPDARILVVGPFSSADRKSTAAAKTAALTAKATFLDPVQLGWRTAAASAVLSAADQTAVTARLAAALV